MVVSLENFKEAIEEVLDNCGRMPKHYELGKIDNQGSNQIVLEAIFSDMEPQRILITLEEI